MMISHFALLAKHVIRYMARMKCSARQNREISAGLQKPKKQPNTTVSTFLPHAVHRFANFTNSGKAWAAVSSLLSYGQLPSWKVNEY